MLMKNCREIPFALVPYSQEHHHKFVCLVVAMVGMFQLRRSIVMLNGSDGKVKDVQGTVIWDGRWKLFFGGSIWWIWLSSNFFLTFIICIDNYITGSFFQKIVNGNQAGRYIFSRKCEILSWSFFLLHIALSNFSEMLV